VPDDVRSCTKKMIDFWRRRKTASYTPAAAFEAADLEVFSASHRRENPLLHLALVVKIYL
jgi:hypothetical protein